MKENPSSVYIELDVRSMVKKVEPSTLVNVLELAAFCSGVDPVILRHKNGEDLYDCTLNEIIVDQEDGTFRRILRYDRRNE